jgi:hypothetical protein
MRHALYQVVLVPLCVLGLLACGSEDDDEGTSASKWEGTSEHISAEGTIGGEAVDISVDGQAAQDVEVLFCERNYADGAIEKIELKYVYTRGGQEAELELEFAAFDYSKDPENPISVGTADESSLTSSDMLVAMKIETEDGAEIEDEAESGSFTLEELSGTPDDDGIIPDGEGKFGGHLDVEMKGGGSLQISFTARCGENDLGG